MIQLNLLPDVKMEYIHAQRARRLVISVAALVTVAAVALLVLILLANTLQKKHINDLSKDISKSQQQLKNEPQINRILTVQNQLASLNGLHDTKPAATRLLGYLNSLTPNNVSISEIKVDFLQQTISITGSADKLATVNKYVDTLKFTTYNSDNAGDNTKAFKNVVLTSFALSAEAQNGKQASYGIDFTYDPIIFDITNNVQLSVPNLITTRSELDRPSDLFQVQQQTKPGGQ